MQAPRDSDVRWAGDLRRGRMGSSSDHDADPNGEAIPDEPRDHRNASGDTGVSDRQRWILEQLSAGVASP